MLDAKVGRSRTTPAEQEESQESDDIAISPIGIPLIAGQGGHCGNYAIIKSNTTNF